MYCGFDMGCGPYLAFPKVIFKNMETEITPNKGVQGTRHKVPGPLTPDVRTENERCGTMLSKGATAMRMP